jgi:hypothetical protein
MLISCNVKLTCSQLESYLHYIVKDQTYWNFLRIANHKVQGLERSTPTSSSKVQSWSLAVAKEGEDQILHM